MIPFTIIMMLAFTWLGYETDWMRVRLLRGIDKPPIIPCTLIEISHLRSRYFNNGFRRSMKNWGSYIAHAIAEPLCGWEYIRDYGELQPEYTMEVVAYGVRNRIMLKNPGAELLKDIARSMLHKAIIKDSGRFPMHPVFKEGQLVAYR